MDGKSARGELGLGSRRLYVAKAAYTHARSLTWRATRGVRTPLEGLRILFYHRVSDDHDELAVTPRRFEQQMRWLAAHGYRALDVDAAADAIDAGDGAERIVGLSFDDGYLDVADAARPVLAELDFRATVYVVPGAVEGRVDFGWYGQTPPLIPRDRLAELDREGVLRFEAHTMTHPNLLTIDDESARSEIEQSKAVLEEWLGRPVSSFCYPAGLFGERDRQLAIAAGYRSAVSCEPGVNAAGCDMFALRRIQIDARDRLFDFVAKVQGAHDSPPPLRDRYRRRRYGAGSGRSRAASSSR